ncbi:hypothetical protein CRYUN_Cryun16bG0037200 [Craigia yunnanensis]
MLSPPEIVSNLPAKNPDPPTIIDRILRVLAAHSILACNLVTDKDGHTKRLFGISSIGKYFLQNEDEISVIPMLNVTLDKCLIECWNFFKGVTLEGGSSFVRGFGMHFFEMAAKDSNFSKIFNHEMSNQTTIVMKKGINFDMPLVVKDAPNFPGVEHVGGDMFTKVRHGEVTFMKSVLHDWGDEQHLKLMKNCYDAIPECGKVILLESIVPELSMTDLVTTTTLSFFTWVCFTCSLVPRKEL